MVKETQKQVTVSFPAKMAEELFIATENAGHDSIGKYMLDLHDNRQSRNARLESFAPHINYLGYKDDVMTLEDTHADKIIGIRFKDNRLWIVGDSKENCNNLAYKFYCAIHPDFVKLVDSESRKKK